MKRLLSTITGLTALLPLLVRAHEGHGLGGAHWHATDVLGFIALAVLVGVVIWHLRK